MPWVESKTLMGKIGEYIVMMRETETEYLVAAATNEEARTLSIPLDFLPEGFYTIQLMLDGEDAHYLTNRETYQVKTQEVKSGDSIQVKLAPGGGACVLRNKLKHRGTQSVNFSVSSWFYLMIRMPVFLWSSTD